MIGITTRYSIPADIPTASDVVLSTAGLTSPIAALQKQKIRAWVKLSVGATGGVRSLVAVPAGGTLLSVTTKLFNTVTPSLTTSPVNTVFTNALAAAGTHWMEIEAYIVNGATAGVVDVQFAQNTSDALTLTILAGGSMDVSTF
jgi:hypothetical protein